MLLKERAQRLSSMRQVAADLEAIRAGRASEGMLSEQRGQEQSEGASVPLVDTPSHADDAAAHLAIGAGQPPVALRVPAPPGAFDESPSGAAEGAVFVAREQELGRLSALLDAALAAQSQVAFVVGEAGQGKTALLQAFAQRASRRIPI